MGAALAYAQHLLHIAGAEGAVLADGATPLAAWPVSRIAVVSTVVIALAVMLTGAFCLSSRGSSKVTPTVPPPSVALACAIRVCTFRAPHFPVPRTADIRDWGELIRLGALNADVYREHSVLWAPASFFQRVFLVTE